MPKQNASPLKILARLSVEQFAGYCLYGVELKTRSQRTWKGAVQHFGRTDTIEQAIGRAAEYTLHLPIECIRHDACYFSWRYAREVMGLHRDEYKYQEGLVEWGGISIEQKQGYHDAGVAFMERYRIDVERRRVLDGVAHNNRLVKFPKHLLAALELPNTVNDADTITAAYRRAVAIHHPDKGGKAERFIAVRAAYKRLSAYWVN